MNSHELARLILEKCPNMPVKFFGSGSCDGETKSVDAMQIFDDGHGDEFLTFATEEGGGHYPDAGYGQKRKVIL